MSIIMVQIADTHFGPTILGEGTRLFQGFCRHSMILARQLVRTIEDIVRACNETDTIAIAICGDLTGSGADEEFVVAHTFLRSAFLTTRRPQKLGLRWSRDLFTVPGNHDQWGGKDCWPPPAYDCSLAGLHYSATPWRDKVLCSKSRCRLELFGVDSASGMADQVWNSKAKGRISPGEFKLLRDHIQNSLRDEASDTEGWNWQRAIVCHHTLARKRRWWKPSQLLEPDSICELSDIMWQAGIKALLTGHAHTWQTPFRRKAPDGQRYFREIRCPTTLQGPPTVQPVQHGFWVHRVGVDEQGRPSWSIRGYGWDAANLIFRPFRKVRDL